VTTARRLRFVCLAGLAGCGAGEPAAPLSPSPLGCENATGDPRLEYVYVVDTEGDSVTVINPRACTVTATIDVAPEPRMANASASGRWVYVGSGGTEPTLSLIDTEENTVSRTVPLPFAPEVMIFDAAHVNLWIAHRATGQVVVFDTIEKELVADVPLEPGTQALSMTEGTPGWMMASNPAGGFVQVFDPFRLEEVARIDVGGEPLSVDYASASARSYACVDGADPALLVIPSEGAAAHVVSKRIPLPSACTEVRFDHGRYGVAVMPQVDQAIIIDTATDRIAATLDVGDAPDTIGITGDRAVVANRGSGDASVLDLEALTELSRPTISDAVQGDAPRQLRGAMDRNFMYAVSPEDDTLVILDLRDGTARGAVPTGALPGPVVVAGEAGGSCC